MKKTAICLLTYLLLQSPSFSQTLKGSNVTTWTVLTHGSNTPFRDITDYDRQNSILYLSETEAIVSFEEERGSGQIVLSVKNGERGVAKVNNKGLQRWKTLLHDGHIFGMATLNKNIIVFSAKEWTGGKKNWTLLKFVTATLINATNGKIIKEEQVPINIKKFAEIQVIKSKAGEFQYLMVRQSQWGLDKGFALNKYETEIRLTEAIDLYTISEDLKSEHFVSLKNISGDMEFLDAIQAPNGNINIAWIKTGSLVLDTYLKGQDKLATRISTPFEWNQKWIPTFVLQANGAMPSQVALAIDYTMKNNRAIKTVLFDIDTKKAVVYDEILSSDYRKKLEETAIVADGQKRNVNNKVFHDMQVSNIHFYGNKVIVVKEVVGNFNPTNSRNIRYYTGDVVISVHDVGEKEPQHFLLNKYVERFIGRALSFGSRVVNDKLQFITLDDGNMLSYTTVFGEIDLKNMKWQIVTPAKENGIVAKSKNPVEPGTTIWFPNAVIVNYLNQKALGGSTMVSELKTLTF